MANAESNIGLNAENSSAGAIGVMQLMPETAESLGVDPYNEDENIEGGIKYLKQMLDKFGDTRLATAAYNAGPGAVQKYGDIPPYEETQNYVERIHSWYDNSPEYSDENSNTRQEDIYTGENGQAEGKYWVRQNNGVSFEGAQPDLLNAVDALSKWYYEKTGKPLYVTAGTNGYHPSNGSEHGHDAGWKVDVNDSPDGVNVDGFILGKNDGEKGSLTDEFIAYGRSLGLGMNWEGDHIDVALDGTQWDGNGEHAGGFNPSKNRTSQTQSTVQNISTPTEEEENESALPSYNENETESGIDFEDNFFGENEELTKRLLNDFVLDKLENADDENFNFLSKLTDENYQFVDNEKNRNALREEFGEELREFLESQGYLKEKPAQIQQQQETPQTPQVKIESPEIKATTKNLDNIKASRAGLVEQVRLVGKYASENNNFELMNAANNAEQSGDVNQMKKIVQENPVPAEFRQAQESENIEGNESLAEKPKVKDGEKIKDKDLKLAMAEVSEDKKSRIAQGKAILRVAKAYGVEFEDYETNSLLKGSKKIFPNVKEKMERLGIFNTEEKNESDDFKNLSQTYLQSQKNLDKLHRETQKILDTGETRASRQALSEWNQALQAHRALGDKLSEQSKNYLPESRRTRVEQKKSLPQLESELADLKEQQKIEEEIALNALKSGNEKSRLTATDNFKKLKTQIADKDAEIKKYKESPEYEKDLYEERAKLADLQNEGKKNPRIDEIDRELARIQAEKGNKIKSKRGQIQKTKRNISKSFEEMIADKVNRQKSQLKLDEKSRDEVQQEIQSVKPVQQQNQNFDDVQQQTKQILENIRAEQNEKEVETQPESKKTYHFDGTKSAEVADNENIVNVQVPETTEEILKSLPTIHSKLKTESNPNLKRFIDEQVETLRQNPDDEDARGELQNILNRKFTKAEIADFENQAKNQANVQEQEKLESVPKKVTQKNISAVQQIAYDKLLANKLPENKDNIDQAVRYFTNEGSYSWGLAEYEKTDKKNAEKLLQQILDENISEDDAYFLATRELIREGLGKNYRWSKADEPKVKNMQNEISNLFHETSRGSGRFKEIYEKAKEYEKEIDAMIPENREKLKEEERQERQKWHREIEENKKNQAKENPVEKNSEGVTGDSETINTDAKSKVNVRYKVVENEDIIPSHVWEGEITEKNPAYEQELQPRNSREEELMIAELKERAKELDPTRLMAGENVNQGAPVVRNDGMILNGTGRVLTLRWADSRYKNKFAEYKQHLIDNAKKYGLDSEEISKMKTPILVREVEGDLDSQLINDIITSRTGGSAMKQEEVAKIDATNISDETIDKYVKGESNFSELREDIINDIAPLGDVRRNTLYNGKDLSDIGISTAEKALFALAYNDDALLTKIANGDSDVSKTFRQALLESAPRIIWANRLTKDAGYNLGQIIADAANKFVNLRGKSNDKKAVNKWVTDQSVSAMFDPIKNSVVDIVDFVNQNSSKENNIKDFLTGIAKAVYNQYQKDMEPLFNVEEFNQRIDEIVARKKEDNGVQRLFDAEKMENVITEPKKESRFARFRGESATTNADSTKNIKSRKLTKKEISEKLADYIKEQVNIDVQPYRNLKYEKAGTLLLNWKDLNRTYQTEIQHLGLEYGGRFTIVDNGGLGKILIPNESLISSWNEELNKKNPSEKDSFDVESIPDVSITDDMIVADENLTSQQKTFTEIGKNLNLPIKFFKGDNNFKGVLRKGTSYINVNNKNFERTFYHEMAHYLAHFNRKMFDDIIDAGNITDEQKQMILDKSPLYENLSDRQLEEEILADNFMDFAKRADFLRNIGRQNKSLAEKFISWLKSLMDKFTSYFSNPKGGLTRTQRNAMYDAFNKNVRAMVDSDGNKIFRVSNTTSEIQKFNGEKLPEVRKTLENSADRYSIDPNDNSNESLYARIKNIVSGIRTGKNERWSKATTQLLEELTDYKIRYNHFLGDELAVIDKIHKMIRVQHQNDFESLMPKIGEIIAEDLKLPTTERMKNYIADWILTGALNNNSAESREFQKAMRNNPVKFEQLMKVRQSFQYYQDLAPEEKYGVRIVDKVNKKSTQSATEFLKEEFADDLNPLAALEEKIKKDYGVKFNVLSSVYKQARLFKGVGGLVAENMILAETDEEVASARAALQKVFPNVDWNNFKPLAKIIKDIGGKKNLQNFNEFCWAKLDKEMHIKNRSIKNESSKFVTLNDEKTADAVIAKFENQFGQSQKDFVNYSNTLLAIMRDAGIITQEKYDEIIQKWENYIPTNRIFDNAEDIDLTDSMRRKHGSKADIRNPVQVVAKNAILFVNASQKNKIKLQLANMARCGAYGKWISEEDFIRNGESAISFKENGKRKYLRVTPEIKRAVDSLSGNQKQGTFIAELFHTISSIVASLQTALSPAFAVGNPFRDAQESFLYGGKVGGVKGLIRKNPIATFFAALKYAIPAIGKAMYNTFTKNKKSRDSLYYEWAAMGGSQASFISADMDKTQETIDNLSMTGAERWLHNPFTQFLRSLQTFSEELEAGTRLTVYKRNKNAYAEKNSDGKATLADMEQAALDSRNATIDFARAGRSMRTLNKYFRFSNAAVQDIDKSLDLMKDIFVPLKNKLATEEDKSRFGDAVLKVSLGIFLPTIALFLLHKDDDWYKNATPQWQKDTSWILGEGIKIPKSYSFASKLISTWLEEFFLKDEPIKAQRIFQPFLDATPSLMPTLLTPIVEGLSNYSFFYKGALVPIKEQQKAAYEQYGEKTSELAKWLGATELAEGLGKLLFGKSGGISPRKIDNAINSYTGILGSIAQGASNLTSQKKRENIWDLTEFPLTKRLFFDPYKNPQVVADYYDLRSEQRELYNTYRDSIKRGEKIKPSGYDEKLWKRIQAKESAMTNLAKKQRALLENTKIPADEMKRRYRELTEQEIKIAKAALGR